MPPCWRARPARPAAASWPTGPRSLPRPRAASRATRASSHSRSATAGRSTWAARPARSPRAAPGARRPRPRLPVPGLRSRRVDAHHIRHWARRGHEPRQPGAPVPPPPRARPRRRLHGRAASWRHDPLRRPDGRAGSRRCAVRVADYAHSGFTATGAGSRSVRPHRPGASRRREPSGIDHDACVQRSTERMDLGYAVDAMLEIAPPGRSPDVVAVG